MSSQMKDLTWNVLVTHDPDHVISELRGMVKQYRPHTVSLQECSRLRKKVKVKKGRKTVTRYVSRLAEVPGYKVLHYVNSGVEPADTAILVRDDLPMNGRLDVRLKLPWIGPKQGKKHPPRVYRWTRVKISEVWWKKGALHGPFGQGPKDESIKAIARWFKMTKQGRPTVMSGDTNMKAPVYREKLQKELPSIKVAGHGIDLGAYRNCDLIDSKDLGFHGSDHQAKLFTYNAK